MSVKGCCISIKPTALLLLCICERPLVVMMWRVLLGVVSDVLQSQPVFVCGFVKLFPLSETWEAGV